MDSAPEFVLKTVRTALPAQPIYKGDKSNGCC
jgi:hypothetical protein